MTSARLALATLALALTATSTLPGCGDDGRPVNVPVVEVGAYEAQCQTQCQLASGEGTCTQKHSEFCLARCRARTNGLPQACADCLFSKGTPIKGFIDSFGDPACTVGGPGEIDDCASACDVADAPPAPSLTVLCQLTCGFYMSEPTPLACSAGNISPCLSACMTTIGAHGRVCSDCVIDQAVPSRICINDNCDCEMHFQSETGFSCSTLCDATP